MMRHSLLLLVFAFFYTFAIGQSIVLKSQESVQLTSSDLPIVVINTNGKTIVDDPKIQANFTLYNRGAGQRNYLTDVPQFNGYCNIEIRGSSSQMFPKKSYGFESWDAKGVSIDTSFLGMPTESDWILNANYTDKSFIRNVMAYQIWQNMGHYSTRYHFVEVIINNQYQGIYIFSEKIKRDKNRLDIAKLSNTQNTGDLLTGGYIFKVDKQTGSGGAGWSSSYLPNNHANGQSIFFLYEYPKDVDITAQQKTYLRSNVNTFETVLKSTNFADTVNGFRKYASEKTFIDYFLVNELSKNVDGYRISTYINKERDSKGGKIRMGPVWDYDIAWHNADYYGGFLSYGWAYQFPDVNDWYQVPFWWSRLLEDTRYQNNLKCRWENFRQNILSNAWFDNYIDSIAGQLNEAQVRNFTQWPILGVYVWPNPWPYATTYQGEVNSLKSWIHDRLYWLDNNMPGTCSQTNGINEPEANTAFSIYPNPVSDNLYIQYSTEAKTTLEIKVFNPQGVLIAPAKSYTRQAGEWTESMNVTSFKPGIYLLRISMNGIIHTQRFIKI